MKFVQTSSTSNSVCREFRLQATRLAAEWAKVLRIDVVISTTTTNSSYGLSGIRSWKIWRFLTLIHWYLPKELFGLIHIELEERVPKFGTDKDIVAQAMLRSEQEMVLFLLETSCEFSNERELFGELLAEIDLKRFHFYRILPKRPKRTIRRRGYNDQGSRRLPHQLPANAFVDFTQEQNRREEYTDKTLPEHLNLIKGWIT